MRENVLIKYFGGEKNLNTPSRILLVALEEFGEKPPSLVSVNEITRRAECNVAAVSYYFGGKNELYVELIRQVTEYLRVLEGPFWKRFDELKLNPSAEGARQILRDYFTWRIRVKPISNKMLKNIFVLIGREEIYEGKFFAMIHEGFMKSHMNFMAGAIEMASKGKIKGDEAKISAMAFVSQIMRFTSSKEYLRLNMNWRTVGEKKLGQVRDTILNLLDKALA